MKRKWKVLLGVLLVLIIAGGVFASIRMNQRATVTVQTGKVVRQDITSLVTASGEIKPRNYINIGANAQGIITGIFVKEGDRVRKDQVVASIESIQASGRCSGAESRCEFVARRLRRRRIGHQGHGGCDHHGPGGLDRSEAEVDRTKMDFDRAKELYNAKLVAKQEFDTEEGGLRRRRWPLSARARRVLLRQSAQREPVPGATVGRRSAESRRPRPCWPASTTCSRSTTRLRRWTGWSRIFRFASAKPWCPESRTRRVSTIMTIADMSLITAEVKVDETEIVNVKLGQPADITIDAIPNRRSRATSSRSATRPYCAPPVSLPRRAPFRARKPRTSRSSSPSTIPRTRSGPGCRAPPR